MVSKNGSIDALGCHTVYLLDLVAKDVTGKDAEAALGRARITTNKNAVPNDPRSPFVTSGLRLGSPAATTRGFGPEQMIQVADWIADVIDNIKPSMTTGYTHQCFPLVF